MTKISRRSLLLSSATSIAVAAIPTTIFAEATVTVAKAPSLMWSVGTPGEWDHQVIRAPTAEAARRAWVAESIGGDCCEISEEEREEGEDPANCECEWCSAFNGCEAERQVAWDGKNVKAGDADWVAVGLGACCAKCGYETFAEEGGQVVAGRLLCESCLSEEDWRFIDPERADELFGPPETKPLPAHSALPSGEGL